MPITSMNFLPRALQKAFARVSGPESLRSLLYVIPSNPASNSYWDDFQGSPTGTWPANANWMYPATVGTGTEVIGITAAANGTLTATTGGTSGNGAYQYLGLNWIANQGGIYYIARAKVNTITSAKLELGLTDSITNEGIVNAKATPTWTATDAVGWCFDTSHNGSMDFMSVKAGTTGANIAGFTMDTNYHIYEIVVGIAGQVEGFVDGQNVGGAVAGVTATVALGPEMGCTTRTATLRTGTWDYQGVVGPRGVSLTV